MRGLNYETISICGGILEDFCELRSRLPKSTCIGKFCMAVTSEVENQKHFLAMSSIKWRGCDNNNIVVRSRFRSRDFPPSFFQDIFLSFFRFLELLNSLTRSKQPR